MPRADFHGLQDARSHHVDVEGLQVHYRHEGAGPPVLLLHGSGSTLLSFDGVAAGLLPDHDVVRIDLPGFGFTGPRPDRDYRIETFTAFTDAFMGAIGLTSAHVVGHSMGGNIAWNLAAAHPPRVRSLVLLNATGYPGKTLPPAFRLARNPLLRPLLHRWAPRSATARNLRSIVGPRFTVTDAMVDRAAAMLALPGNRSAFVDFANTDQADHTALLPRIGIPTLVVRSPAVDGQYFARDIPGSRELVLEGIGHLMPEEAPGDLAAAIRSHLEKIGAR
ncbi:alpha/beta fold hydrolase [Streptomyces sp. NPDC059479]|uniref:alpha/beta fold hydrolase n=1 Tax=Streptomyces sp. NPDC059479 TaxID=3346848 RepID=UPI0036B434D3